jgi:hypothetical protein
LTRRFRKPTLSLLLRKVINSPTGKGCAVKLYKNEYCQFALPEEWPCIPDPELAIFQSPDQRFRLTISVRPINRGIDNAETGALFSEYVRCRRLSELEVAQKDDVLLTPEQIVDGGGFWYSKYAGIHKSANRRVAALMTIENCKLVTFYVESVGTTDEDFNLLANFVFENANVT